ncbi:unnamed protein product [Clonostachys chloroleuca]|uniref:F-box domain-containing protein n=1 Tax=Clonostachys chloroleuca TaxID=1926264 RepID=A0AA35M2J5_9HYPO|nr:unnamed protein product [Clonostachys chloroleuca]
MCSTGLPSPLLGLPAEILDSVASHLSNPDRKSLRLTCTVFGRRVLLQIDRVFLSANPRNIQVFRAIADHEIYRQKVVELIWDDARLDPPPEPPLAYQCRHRAHHIEPFWQQWYQDVCDRNSQVALPKDELETPNRAARASWIAAQPPVKDMWNHYKELFRQQQEIMKTSDDALALQYGLERFTSLTQITLTPAAHGVEFNPLYETPMIRALPYGFNYPIPRGWPCSEPGSRLRITQWSSEERDEKEKNRWRGYRIILWTLARVNHRITDFVVDVGLLNTGLNAHMFDQPCPEQEDLVTVLLKPGFRRLDLAVILSGQTELGFPAFRNRQLYEALSQASDLEHISLRTNMTYDLEFDDWMDHDEEQPFIPLLDIFPVERWPRLRHWGLSGFSVRVDDLVGFLSLLPDTLRSVELNFLKIQDGHGSHRELLFRLRDTLDWRGRNPADRPKVTMGWQEEGVFRGDGYAVWVDDEVNEFLYGDGANPFLDTSPEVEHGIGIQKCYFDPEFERPNVGTFELMRRGFLKNEMIIMGVKHTVQSFLGEE